MPNSEKTIDLHLHSTASDGALTPTEVVRAASCVGLSAIALTDHDTVDGIKEARAEGDKLGIKVVAGIELTIYEYDTEIHLLGYFIDNVAPAVELLKKIRARRVERAKKICENLASVGLPVDFNEVLKLADGGAVGLPHIARVLVRDGFVLNMPDVYNNYIGSTAVAHEVKWELKAIEAVETIHLCGGLAVLAHPGIYESIVPDFLRDVVPLGLDGIEVFHSHHNAKEIKYYESLANHYDLFLTGGSDFHGPVIANRKLGKPKVSLSILETMESVHKNKYNVMQNEIGENI